MAIVALAFFIVAAISVTWIGQSLDFLRDLSTRDLSTRAAVTSVYNHLDAANTRILGVMGSVYSAPGSAERLNGTLGSIEKDWTILTELIPPNDRTTDHEAAAAAIASLQTFTAKLLPALRENKPLDKLYDEWLDILVPLRKAIQSATNQLDNRINQRAETDLGQAAVVNTATFLAVAVGLLVLLWATISLVRGVVRPIKSMTDVMSRIAGGDLDVDVPHGDQKSEIGGMAKALEVFRQNGAAARRMETERHAEQAEKERRQAAIEKRIGEFDQRVRASLDALAEVFGRMRVVAENMLRVASETDGRATSAAGASGQTQASVESTAAASTQISESISDIGRHASQSAQMAGQAVEETNRTDIKVKSLAEAADRIGEVIRLISDIAGQTNLLALNATIEAARAGDAGKGFSVVAGEVKSLANQTAKATQEIAQQVSAIQTASNDSVEAIKSIGAAIGEINEIAGTISGAVHEQAAAAQDIARNMQQAAVGTHEVTTNIAGVTKAAGQSTAAANDVLAAIGEISRQTDGLRQDIQNFFRDVRAA